MALAALVLLNYKRPCRTPVHYRLDTCSFPHRTVANWIILVRLCPGAAGCDEHLLSGPYRFAAIRVAGSRLRDTITSPSLAKDERRSRRTRLFWRVCGRMRLATRYASPILLLFESKPKPKIGIPCAAECLSPRTSYVDSRSFVWDGRFLGGRLCSFCTNCIWL